MGTCRFIIHIKGILSVDIFLCLNRFKCVYWNVKMGQNVFNRGLCIPTVDSLVTTISNSRKSNDYILKHKK